jgi:hypothetical protein
MKSKKETNIMKAPIPPCKDCICIPMCKNRQMFRLVDICSLIKEYLFHEPGDHETEHVKQRENPDERIILIIRELSPSYLKHWKWLYNYPNLLKKIQQDHKERTGESWK